MIKSEWEENVILVDAEYLGRVAFDLIVNFERMINRRIPPADLCHWLDCIALDGGMRPGENSVQAVFLHPREEAELRNFSPAKFSEELDGKAFKDHIAEFTLFSFPVEEVIKPEDFFIEALENILQSQGAKRVMVIADMDAYGHRVKKTVTENEGKDITLFAMQPVSGRGFSNEILGYSLMSALGIRGDEL